LVAGGGAHFQRVLADEAVLDMVLDGLPLAVVELLIEETFELVEGHAGSHLRSIHHESEYRGAKTSAGRSVANGPKIAPASRRDPGIALSRPGVAGMAGAVAGA
jgi:hypothetical protein